MQTKNDVDYLYILVQWLFSVYCVFKCKSFAGKNQFLFVFVYGDAYISHIIVEHQFGTVLIVTETIKCNVNRTYLDI